MNRDGDRHGDGDGHHGGRTRPREREREREREEPLTYEDLGRVMEELLLEHGFYAAGAVGSA